MIVGCNHIKLAVSDLAASWEFYGGLLGFQQGPEFRDEHGKVIGSFLYISRGMFLELFESDEPIVPFSHFCLQVTDLPELIERLQQAGVKTTDIFFGRSKAWIASIWDPDGHHIELNEFSHPESWMKGYLETVER
ncbi:MAG: VOC family protein [Armatimonadota bacterium]